MTKKQIIIGGASGYWGESAMATPQLLHVKGLDYLVYDYLAEITMSILARAKAKDPTKGYATDFVDFVMKPFLPMIAAKGVKVIANAGGVNPEGCAKAVRVLIEKAGLDLKVAVITGDDLIERKQAIATSKPVDMFTDAPFPPLDKIASINAYLGAFPIAGALDMGADIIITGRCVDSAVTLGACIHEFGWDPEDFDRLASGSLAGHILECGPQATGGNFTDWEDAGDIANIGYPVAEVSPDGSFIVTKPEDTGGIVNIGTVTEQMLYEIGDPESYILPDVICDFSMVRIEQVEPNRVSVSPARGRTAPPDYKTCLTYRDGFRAGSYATFYGENADQKAQKFAEAAHVRANKTLRLFNLGEFTEFSAEIIGAGSQTGVATPASEVVIKVAVKHPDVRGAGIFLKELAGMGLATPPGLSGFTGVRGKPSPVMRVFSYTTPKADITITIDVDGEKATYEDPVFEPESYSSNTWTFEGKIDEETVDVPLSKLAWGRSGDKGNKANIGIIPRQPEYWPYIHSALTQEKVAKAFSHFMAKPDAIEIFFLHGTASINILIDDVLGGGGAASLRNDAQGKGYAQILLSQPIPVSKEIAKGLS